MLVCGDVVMHVTNESIRASAVHVDVVDSGGGCDSGLEVSVITAVVVSAGVVL